MKIEQVEKAASVMAGYMECAYTRSHWEKIVRAAAPHLQMPIAPITDEEWDCIKVVKNVGILLEYSTRSGFNDLMAKRNAQANPDPRREKIREILYFTNENCEQIADRILSALDSLENEVYCEGQMECK